MFIILIILIPLGVISGKKANCETELLNIAPHLLSYGGWTVGDTCDDFDPVEPCSLGPMDIPNNDAEYFTWTLEMTQQYLGSVQYNKVVALGPLIFAP